MILPVLRASGSLNAVLMEEFGEGRQWRRGRARPGWTQTRASERGSDLARPLLSSCSNLAPRD